MIRLLIIVGAAALAVGLAVGSWTSYSVMSSRIAACQERNTANLLAVEELNNKNLREQIARNQDILTAQHRVISTLRIELKQVRQKAALFETRYKDAIAQTDLADVDASEPLRVLRLQVDALRREADSIPPPGQR